MGRSDGRVKRLPPERFDVICAGQPLWRGSMSSLGDVGGRSSAFVNVTKMLTMSSLHVGWAAVLEDDRRGRALLAEMAAAHVQVGAVSLASSGTDLVVVDASGGWSGLVSNRDEAVQVELPPFWSSQVLLLSGLRPATSSLAALCKAARKARRDGTVVVLDVVGSLRDWTGHDARVLSMVIREADVVRCSFFDLAVIGADAAAVRRTMRSNATLVLDDDGGAIAMGTFGDVRVQASRESSTTEVLAESYTAAICAEYARPRGVGETPAGRWHRVLRDEARRLAATVPLTRQPSAGARF
jgi:2-dehydro-3-deoxygluconokinase